MLRALSVIILGVLHASVLFGATSADDAVPVETELVAEVRESVPGTAGRTTYRFVPATVLAQGRVVYYTVRIRNPTTVFARDISVIQLIPANTTYVSGSAAGPGAEISFSVDGGQTFRPEGELEIAEQANAPRRALPSEYTHIRWRLRNPLAPGAIALARFRAVFN
jgi:uncharacterized repeat protein (TIGR01451 family)